MSTKAALKKPVEAAISLDEARRVAGEIGFPVMVRPSYVLGGRAMAIVYVDGMNIGVIRRDDVSTRMDHPRIREVVETAGEAGEWFAHPAGFLYCRGSRKAPATSRSRVTARELGEAMNLVLKGKP